MNQSAVAADALEEAVRWANRRAARGTSPESVEQPFVLAGRRLDAYFERRELLNLARALRPSSGGGPAAGRPLRLHVADGISAPKLRWAERLVRQAEDATQQGHSAGSAGGTSLDSRAVARRPRVLLRGAGTARGVLHPHTGELCVFDPERLVAAWWAPDCEALPSAVSSAPFRSLLQWWLGPQGLQIVHAGAVGDERGALLVAGPGGSGKSTTCLACHAAGWHYWGDDSVLCEAGPPPRVHPLYSAGTLHSSDLSWLNPSPASLRLPSLADDKALVWTGDAASRNGASARLRALVIPHVDTATSSRIEPLDRAAALRALVPSSLVNLPGSGGASFARLTALVRALPTYRLLAGSRRQAIPEALSPLLEERSGDAS